MGLQNPNSPGNRYITHTQRATTTTGIKYEFLKRLRIRVYTCQLSNPHGYGPNVESSSRVNAAPRSMLIWSSLSMSSSSAAHSSSATPPPSRPESTYGVCLADFINGVLSSILPLA
jgi:hypothetical protein